MVICIHSFDSISERFSKIIFCYINKLIFFLQTSAWRDSKLIQPTMAVKNVALVFTKMRFIKLHVRNAPHHIAQERRAPNHLMIVKVSTCIVKNNSCISDYKNLSPVTDADGIFRSRGGLFTQYRVILHPPL